MHLHLGWRSTMSTWTPPEASGNTRPTHKNGHWIYPNVIHAIVRCAANPAARVGASVARRPIAPRCSASAQCTPCSSHLRYGFLWWHPGAPRATTHPRRIQRFRARSTYNDAGFLILPYVFYFLSNATFTFPPRKNPAGALENNAFLGPGNFLSANAYYQIKDKQSK